MCTHIWRIEVGESDKPQIGVCKLCDTTCEFPSLKEQLKGQYQQNSGDGYDEGYSKRGAAAANESKRKKRKALDKRLVKC